AEISLALDVAALVNQLKETVALQKGVELKRAHLTHETDINLGKDAVTISTDTKLPDVSGTNDGKPIHVSPIDFGAGVTAVGGAAPDLRDLSIKLTSAFLNASGGGATLSHEKITGGFDLSKLQGEAEQFVDLNAMANPASTQPAQEQAPTARTPLRLVGVGSFDLSTDGDLVKSNGQGKVATSLTVTGVDASGIGTLPPVQLTNLTASINGDLHRGATSIDYKNFAAALTAAGITVQGSTSGTEGPVLDHETITANLAGDLSLPSGTGATTAKLSTVSLTSSSNLFSISKTNADAFTIANEKGSLKGSNGSLAIMADLKKLADLGQRFSAATTQPATQPAVVASANKAGQLESGILNGTLNISHADQPQTIAKFDGAVTNLTVSTDQKPITNETIKLTANMTSPDDRSKPLMAEASVASRFATANLTRVSAQLNASMWDKLQHLEATVNAPDLAALGSIINAFSPTTPAKTAAIPPIQDPYQLAFAASNNGPILLALADEDSTAPPTESAHDAAVRRKREKEAKLAKQNKQQAVAADQSPAPFSPLQITSGSATLTLVINRDTSSQTTTVDLTDTKISNLALQRGNQKYAFARPINFNFSAAIKAAADPAQPQIVDQIQQVQIKKLDGDLVVAKLSMPDAITITSPGDPQKLDAKGTIKLDGSIDDAKPLLAVYQGAKPLQYAGVYEFNEAIGTGSSPAGKFTKLGGGGTITNFQVLDDSGKPAVTEAKVDIKNDVDYLIDKSDPTGAKNELDVRTMSMNMTSSGALSLNFVGRIIYPSTKREFRGLGSDPTARLDVTYDAPKVWTIIYPMLSTQQQATYKTLKIEGQKHETFALSGYYPQAKYSYESMSRLNVDGALALDLLDLPQGLTISAFNLPISMKAGVLQTAPGTNQPTTQLAGAKTAIVAKTAICNDGAVDLSEITIDLGKKSPLVSIVKNHKLLQDVKLNPVLADTFGSANLLFKDATAAAGLINMTVVQCNQVPLSDLMTKAPSANAAITYNITDLSIDGPVPTALSSGLQLGGQGIHGGLENGSLTIANGVANNSFTINMIRYKKLKSNGKVDNSDAGSNTQTGTTGENLRAVNLPIIFSGGVVLATEALKDFNIKITPGLLGGINKKAVDLLPNGVVVPVTGTVSKFNIDIVGAVTKSAASNLLGGNGGAGGLGDLLNRKKKKSDGSSNDATSQPSGDPLDNLIDSLSRKKKTSGGN
ncbi:MAG: hypothetical protein JO353_07275, partial [Phycisphaerae bacterium]|nr:hypothetical protein [Phycisphaerae bacterium]